MKQSKKKSKALKKQGSDSSFEQDVGISEEQKKLDRAEVTLLKETAEGAADYN